MNCYNIIKGRTYMYNYEDYYNYYCTCCNYCPYYNLSRNYYKDELFMPFRVQDMLGIRWFEKEHDWSGVWTRRGNSNVFDARWTHPIDSPITAVLTIYVNGNSVRVERRGSSDGNNCVYTGTIARDGKSVSGNYTCDKGGGTWSATIEHAETTCSPGVKGEKIDSGKFDIEIMTFNYEIYECEIKVVSSSRGVHVRTDILSRENRSISYEYNPGGFKYKIILEVREKVLYGTLEIYHIIPFVGWRLSRRIGPSKIGSWNKLKF